MHQRSGPYGSWKAADDSGQFSFCKEHIKVHFLLQRAQIAVMMCAAVLSVLLPTVLPCPADRVQLGQTSSRCPLLPLNGGFPVSSGLTPALRLAVSTHRRKHDSDPLVLACKVARQ